MEEKQRLCINEEKNIFYEYFSKLEKTKEFKTPEFDELENCYKSFHQKKDFYYNKGVKTPKLYNDFICLLNFFSYIFKQYNNISKKELQKFTSTLDEFTRICLKELNEKNIYKLGLLFSISNLLEHLYAVYLSLKSQNSNLIYNRGCALLNINVLDIIDIICNDAYAIIRRIKRCNLCNIFRLIVKSTSCLHKYNISEIHYIANDIKTYLKISDIAYYYYKFKKLYKEIPYIRKIGDYQKNTNQNINQLCGMHNGYFDLNCSISGCILESNVNDEVVVGFAGTDVKHKFMTLFTDFSQIQNVSAAYIYAVGLVDYVNKYKHKEKLSLCGHSLGGGLAQFAAATQKGSVKAVCFNSAGLFPKSLKIIYKFNPWRNIDHYRLKYDLVSRLGTLIGNVYTIDYKPKIRCCWICKCYYSHLISELYNSFKQL